MDPRERPEKRRYVVLVFVDVNPDYYELGESKRADLTAPHIKELTEHLDQVSLVSLRSTGLAQDSLIEILESDDLVEEVVAEVRTLSSSGFSTEQSIVMFCCFEGREGGCVACGRCNLWINGSSRGYK